MATRDLKLMVELLEEMAADPFGTIDASLTMNLAQEDVERVHNIGLLCERGLAEYISDTAAQITNAGHDLLALSASERAVWLGKSGI